MNVPVFIDITLESQAEELRTYFKSLGAEISVEKSPKGIEDDLHKIIGICDSCFKEANETDIELVLNGIVSMLVLIPLERSENLILAFCEKLTKAPTNKLGLVCLRVLKLLWLSLEERSPMRFHVYYHLVQVAGKVDQVKTVFTDIEKLKQQLAAAPPSNEQMQKLLRLLYRVLLDCKQSEQASKVMIELLGTYTTENASQAREEAQQCIIFSLADPSTFLLDHLLALKPVKFLEGELMHDLLTIFVSDKLPNYQQFYKNHKEFVNSLGLNHEQNLKKMRLLTFMQMAENTSEMSFEILQEELQLQEDEVEDFLIDVLKTELVRAKMDQTARKVFVSSTMLRTFGKQNWQQLHDVLTSWKSNLHLVKDSLQTVVSAQNDLLHPQPAT